MLEYEIIAPGKLSELNISIIDNKIPVDDEDLQAIVAYRDREAVGILVFLVEEYQGIIYQLFVKEECRGAGIGSVLHLKLVKYLSRNPDITRIVIDVPYGDSEDSSFLGSIGYVIAVYDNYELKLKLSDVKKWKTIASVGEKYDDKIDKYAKSIAECTDDEISAFQKTMDDTPWSVDLSTVREDYDVDCSTIFIEKGRVKGFLLGVKEDDEINIAFIYSEPAHPLALAFVLYKSSQNAIKKFGDDMVLGAMVKSAGFALAEKTGLEYEARPVFRYVLPLRKKEA